MPINLSVPEMNELTPRISVVGVGGRWRQRRQQYDRELA